MSDGVFTPRNKDPFFLHPNWATAIWHRANGDTVSYEVYSWNQEGSVVTLTHQHEWVYSVGPKAYEDELSQVVINLAPGEYLEIYRQSDIKRFSQK